jgi:uncharacterized LabA/DUF88 family protein
MSRSRKVVSENPFELNPNDTTSAFIDGPSLYWAYKTLNTEAQIDMLKVRDYIEDNSRLQSINYFTVLPPRERRDTSGHTPIKPLADFLDFNGFRVTMKEAYSIPTDMGLRTHGSINVDLSLAAANAGAKGINHILLFINDDDFIPLVTDLWDKACRVTIVSTAMKDVAPSDLIRKADNFIDLRDIAPLLARNRNRAD